MFSIDGRPNSDKTCYESKIIMKDRNVPIWIGCFSLAVMLLLGVSIPIQFSDARFKDAKQGEEIYISSIFVMTV